MARLWHCRSSALTSLLLCLLPMKLTAQQQPERFVAKDALVKLGFTDLPGMVTALRDGPFGRLCREPEVWAVIEQGLAGAREPSQAWLQGVRRLQELAPDAVGWQDLLAAEIYQQDWSHWRSFSAYSLFGSQRWESRTVVTLEPVADKADELQRSFAVQVARLQAQHALVQGIGLAPKQLVFGHAGLVVTLALPVAVAHHGHAMDPADAKLPAEPVEPVEPAEPGEPFDPTAGGMNEGEGFFVAVPGQCILGQGNPELAGSLQRLAPEPPGLHLHLELRRYLAAMVGMMGLDADADADADASADGQQGIEAILGTANLHRLLWDLRPQDGLMLEQLRIGGEGPIGGLLAAWLDGSAPLPQPALPERTLLQWRGAADVAKLLEVVDQALQRAELPTLAGLGLHEDVRRAFTGGVSLAIARPAAGGLIPRIQLALGVSDAAAVQRLLQRLPELPWVTAKPLELEGRPCTRIEVESWPAGLQPVLSLDGDLLQIAESGLSMRALWKASRKTLADAVPPAARVRGALPGFDLQWHAGEIHAALAQVWLPLLETASMLGGMPGAEERLASTVPTSDLPDAETVRAALGAGRGQLRRDGNDLVLTMLGPTGGPTFQAVVTAWGPVISAMLKSGWIWETVELRRRLAEMQLARLHAPFVAFEKRVGRWPASLGELVASGDLADAKLLLLPGDDKAEAVVHGGVEVAKSSFRYFADGLAFPEDHGDGKVVLVTIAPLLWSRPVLSRDGRVHDFEPNFAEEELRRK